MGAVTMDAETMPMAPEGFGSDTSTSLSLSAQVRPDRFRSVRRVLMGSYALGFVWWLLNKGLIYQRTVVAAALGIFLVCAFIGKPWRAWALLLWDSLLYCSMWLGYEYSYHGAQAVGFPLQSGSIRNIDRALFFGTDPNVWMNQHLIGSHVRWWEWILSLTYYSHFIVPPIVMAALWATNREQWIRFMRRFATVLAFACLLFALLPTVPPWAAGSVKYPYHLLPPLERATWRGVSNLGFHYFQNSWNMAILSGNQYAAMPSLHVSFATIVPLFFRPWIRNKWLRNVIMLFPVLMLVALVTYAEHWVIDGIAAWVIVGFSFWFWGRYERRQRERRADRARTALTSA